MEELGLIMYVEDDQDTREMVTLQCEAQGQEIVALANAEEALSFLEDNQPELAVIDVILPDQSGEALFQEMQERDIRIPVIFSTVQSLPGDLVRFEEMGVTGVIPKPFRIDNFLQQIKEIYFK